ncbi:hypothetical protein [Nitrosomonas sp.]|uniref:hypothetical protein n=1 Tax=Nitrosomonas sp. TaxID=42353 RepID=UPI0032EDD810
MTVSSIVDKLIRGLIGKNKANPVSTIPLRFFQVFEDHGIAISQIPRLLPEIQFNDLKSEDSLLQVLNYEILEQTAKLFGIRRLWLEGVDDQIYELHSCYKHPAIFFTEFDDFCHRKDNDLYLPVRAFTTCKSLDYTDSVYQPIALVLVDQIAVLDDKEIFRYCVLNDAWDWGYAPTRIQVKAMIHLISIAVDESIPLHVIAPDQIEDLYASTVFPGSLIKGCYMTDPALDDYTTTGYYNSKETDEFPEVLKYIEEHGLRDLITKEQWKRTQPFQDSENSCAQSVKSQKPRKPGKRERNNQELWEPIREAARVMWAQEGEKLTISEAVRRIKKLEHLKASKLQNNTIHKHIADLAPNHKSGRRPKNSPKLSS